MKVVLLVVLLAAAATAAVVSNEVPDVVEIPDVADRDEVTEVDMNEMPEVIDRDEVTEVDMNEMPEVVVTDEDELVDAADLTDVAEETAVASRRNLSQGSVGSSDVRVYNGEHRANGVAGHFHVRDITIRTSRRITAIRVTRIGASQNATPSVVGGGIGNSSVTIRIRSATGRGFHYRIQIYGR